MKWILHVRRARLPMNKLKIIFLKIMNLRHPHFILHRLRRNTFSCEPIIYQKTGRNLWDVFKCFKSLIK